MKTCAKCHTPKPLTDFPIRKDSKDGRHSYCYSCKAKHAKKKYRANPRHKLNQLDAIRKRNAQIVNDIKRQAGCKFCGEKEPICLDFHHINPRKKDMAIAHLLRVSMVKLLKEMTKCIIVCSNCHRKLHAGLIPSLHNSSALASESKGGGA